MMKKQPSVTPRWIAGAAALGAFAALLWLERRRPLRQPRDDPARRDLRNLAVAGLSAATLRVLEKPVVEPLARVVEARRWGLVHRLGLPPALGTVLAVALMDYTLFHWHILTHRLPLLWRFHRVHHLDRDLSATTALRFHFGEMALSVPYRAAQIVLIGAGPGALGLWQKLTLTSIIFHHSNIRLPRRVERALSIAVMTPRLHGIHHSVRHKERDTNWSSGLTLWDRLHGSLKTDVTQEAITVGVQGPPDRALQALPTLIALPFGRAGAPFRAAR